MSRWKRCHVNQRHRTTRLTKYSQNPAVPCADLLKSRCLTRADCIPETKPNLTLSRGYLKLTVPRLTYCLSALFAVVSTWCRTFTIFGTFTLFTESLKEQPESRWTNFKQRYSGASPCRDLKVRWLWNGIVMVTFRNYFMIIPSI